MTCPLYYDITRHCITKFPQIVKYSNYDICETDDYKNCLHFIVFNSKFRCKHMTKCISYFKENTPDFIYILFNDEKMLKAIKDFTVFYCLSEENCKNCENYKRLDSGKKPIKFKFPDGKRHLMGILLKKKITIDK